MVIYMPQDGRYDWLNVFGSGIGKAINDHYENKKKTDLYKKLLGKFNSQFNTEQNNYGNYNNPDLPVSRDFKLGGNDSNLYPKTGLFNNANTNANNTPLLGGDDNLNTTNDFMDMLKNTDIQSNINKISKVPNVNMDIPDDAYSLLMGARGAGFLNNFSNNPINDLNKIRNSKIILGGNKDLNMPEGYADPTTSLNNARNWKINYNANPTTYDNLNSDYLNAIKNTNIQEVLNSINNAKNNNVEQQYNDKDYTEKEPFMPSNIDQNKSFSFLKEEKNPVDDLYYGMVDELKKKNLNHNPPDNNTINNINNGEIELPSWGKFLTQFSDDPDMLLFAIENKPLFDEIVADKKKGIAMRNFETAVNKGDKLGMNKWASEAGIDLRYFAPTIQEETENARWNKTFDYTKEKDNRDYKLELDKYRLSERTAELDNEIKKYEYKIRTETDPLKKDYLKEELAMLKQQRLEREEALYQNKTLFPLEYKQKQLTIEQMQTEIIGSKLSNSAKAKALHAVKNVDANTKFEKVVLDDGSVLYVNEYNPREIIPLVEGRDVVKKGDVIYIKGIAYLRDRFGVLKLIEPPGAKGTENTNKYSTGVVDKFWQEIFK